MARLQFDVDDTLANMFDKLKEEVGCRTRTEAIKYCVTLTNAVMDYWRNGRSVISVGDDSSRIDVLDFMRPIGYPVHLDPIERVGKALRAYEG